jgi:hypothetical protein
MKEIKQFIKVHEIELIDLAIYAVSFTIAACLAILVCKLLPHMYIGKIIFIYYAIAGVIFVLIRIALCATFRPFVHIQKRRMSS